MNENETELLAAVTELVTALRADMSKHAETMTAKYDAIASKLIGPEDKQVQLMTKRTETREIIGNKTMQELIIK